MSARELAIVLLRVVGIYLLIHLVTAGPAAFWALGYLLTSFDQSRSVVSGVDWLGWSQIAFTLWPVFMYAAASITLLVRAPRLAARVVPRDSRPGRVVVGRRLQATLITGVGVAVLAGNRAARRDDRRHIGDVLPGRADRRHGDRYPAMAGAARARCNAWHRPVPVPRCSRAQQRHSDVARAMCGREARTVMPTAPTNAYFTISRSSTSKTRVAPGLILGGAPRSP